MTASTLTYIVARERINDLRRDAERHHRASEVAAPRAVKRSLPKLFARWIGRPATA